MPDVEPVVLPEGYYLDNFTLLLESAVDRYSDILTADEIDFIGAFEWLSIGAMRLYVRLVSRKGPLFRSDPLHYDEIPEIGSARVELNRCGFVSTGGDYVIEDAVRLLRTGELRSIDQRGDRWAVLRD